MAIYMNMSNVSGNVSAKNFADWVALDSVIWGVKRVSDAEAGREHERTFGVPNFSEVTITKKIDQASPVLFSQACIATVIKKVVVCVVQTSNELVPYLEYTLSNAIFTRFSHQLTESEQGDCLQESLEVNFKQISMRYFPRDEKQILLGPLVAGYDVAELELL
jgi:type VI secretion system secreted protein Hcp